MSESITRRQPTEEPIPSILAVGMEGTRLSSFGGEVPQVRTHGVSTDTLMAGIW